MMRQTGGKKTVSILLLGMGNLLKGDDGLGVHAIRRLADERLEGAEFLELGTSLADCFFALERHDHVVALDAVTAGGKPGDLYWLSKEDFVRARDRRVTLHDGDLLDALELAQLRGFRPQLHVAGMEPLRWDEWSLELSSPVRAAFPAYLDMIRMHLHMLEEERKIRDGRRQGRGAASDPAGGVTSDT